MYNRCVAACGCVCDAVLADDGQNISTACMVYDACVGCSLRICNVIHGVCIVLDGVY